jgi:hypothetical protein
MDAPASRINIRDFLESTMDFDWSIVDLGASARVTRGVTYLRATYPLAARGVLRGVLDVMNTQRCPLGQIYGDFVVSPEARHGTTGWLQAHGFIPLVVEGITEAEDAYMLTPLWKEAFEAWQVEDL